MDYDNIANTCLTEFHNNTKAPSDVDAFKIRFHYVWSRKHLGITKVDSALRLPHASTHPDPIHTQFYDHPLLISQ